MSEAEGPHRPGRGLAAERTELAWRRSVLSFAAAALVTMQVFPAVRGTHALAVAGVALLLTPPAWWFASRHARRTQAHLRQEVPRLRHGRRIALVCAGTSLLGLGGTVLVLVF
ncbi:MULTISPECIES: DUF202 domain-containing protein [Isoptericola]|uniref:DUF202 domain-containing protein n=1 Tax=Isoptericola TaxID=254250 RepID=UPI00383A04E5